MSLMSWTCEFFTPYVAIDFHFCNFVIENHNYTYLKAIKKDDNLLLKSFTFFRWRVTIRLFYAKMIK